MNYKIKNAYYFQSLNMIGGVEAHLYYLSKKYSDRDWCVICRDGDPKQIQRLRQRVRVIVVDYTDTIECERFFCTYDTTILDQVKADEVYFVIHADFQTQIDKGFMPFTSNRERKGMKQLAVSKVAQKGFQGESEVVYMPIEPDECEDPILLMSATRLTPEKGYERMKILARELDKANVNYLWFVFSDQQRFIDSPNVIFLQPRLDICDKMGLFDAIVQLSDTEAFSVTMNESLLKGVPIITTPLPLVEEMNWTPNAIILPFNMRDIGEQIEQIRHVKKLKATMPRYRMPKDKWGKLLTGKSHYHQESVVVRATENYEKYTVTDIGLGFIPSKGYEWVVPIERYEDLRKWEEANGIHLIDKV